MAFNINEFKSVVNKHGGPARKNLYVIDILGSNQGNDGMSLRDLRFFSQSATVPGLNYGVADYYPNGFGLKQTIPVSVNQDQFNVVFMCDSDHNLLRFFHQWMQSIINYNYSNGAFSQVDGKLPYEIGYKKDFATTVVIRHYSIDSERYYEYTLYDVFPTQVSGVDLSWSDNNSYATVTVNFAYSNMIMTGSRAGTPTERFARGTGLLDVINSIGSTGQTINQSNLPTSIQDAINRFTSFSGTVNRIGGAVSQIRSGLSSLRNIF